MSVVIDYEDRHVLICKGAVEEVASVCENYQVDEDINPLIRLIRDDLMDEYRSLSAEGYRVLAIAYREFDRTKQVFAVADESELTCSATSPSSTRPRTPLPGPSTRSAVRASP